MVQKFRLTVLTVSLLVSSIFLAGCVSGPEYEIPPSTGVQTTSCVNESCCVPAQCCHPTGCINAAFKDSCNEFCTLECRGPIDCGAGYCGCVNGTCQVIPGPSP